MYYLEFFGKFCWLCQNYLLQINLKLAWNIRICDQWKIFIIRKNILWCICFGNEYSVGITNLLLKIGNIEVNEEENERGIIRLICNVVNNVNYLIKRIYQYIANILLSKPFFCLEERVILVQVLTMHIKLKCSSKQVFWKSDYITSEDTVLNIWKTQYNILCRRF